MGRKNREKKRKMGKFLGETKFKYLNLSVPNQVVIFLSIFWIVSLFLPWVIDNGNSITWNAFNSISWNVGYIMLIMYIFLFFIIFSSSYKEKVKLYTDINFKNHFVIISSGLASICFWILITSFINWLSTLWESFTHGKWLILSMATWILILVFWFFVRDNYKKSSSEIILEQLNQSRGKTKEKDNMKLPF